MITKFKIFELNEDEPKVGDWIVCQPEDISFWINEEDLNRIFSENMGRIVSDNKGSDNHGQYYDVKYSNLPLNDQNLYNDFAIIDSTFSITKNEIKYWSKNKEELETIIQSNKYNL